MTEAQNQTPDPAWSVLVLVEQSQATEPLDVPGRAPFEQWLQGLRDVAARARITARIVRILQGGNFGDRRERIAGAVSELRIDYGPGYRVYYVRVGNQIVVLMGGGTKDSQQGDIDEAVRLWERYKDDVEGRSRDFRR